MSTATETADVTPTRSLTARGLVERAAGSQTSWLVGALALILITFATLRFEEFVSVPNGRNIAIDASILLLMTVGMTYVIITAGIDLSVGSVLVFSQVVAAKAMAEVSGSAETVIAAGVVVAVVCGMGWGLINGFLITRLRVPPLIATLGTLGAAQGAALLITNGFNLRVATPELVTGIGNGRAFGEIPWLVIIVAVITVVCGFFLTQTRFGRYTFAIGSNERAAERAGIDVRRHLFKVYGLSGALAGFAGFLSLARFSTTTISGHTTDNLNAVAAVVIGGTSLFGGVGSIVGSVIGVFIPTVLQNGLVLVGMQPFWQQIAVAIVLVAAVYLDQLRRRRRAAG